MVGRRLAHYEILEKLGAGGMGVVYRARDTKLERVMAVKVVGEGGEAAAKERLLREARAASALNHPNICTIYEVGEAEGQSYIGMEYVEGKPLSGPLPGDDVIRYGIQMADALAHAHERGVVHRDLKSANVMVTPAGRIKVLDFGLAKKLTASEASLTQTGAVAGTLAYMAPEVLQGGPADGRSDVWALGVVLYEIVSGKLPFGGRTAFEATSAILRERPAALGERVGAGLRAVIQRCLAKEPGERYQRAGEIRAALEAIQSDSGGAGAVRSAAAPAEEPRLSSGGRPSAHAEANRYFEAAMMLKFQFDLPRSQMMLGRALEADPHFAEARAWRGHTYWLADIHGLAPESGWAYKAEEELRQALEDDPECARAHLGFAAIYLGQGRKELALGEAEEALRLLPGDGDTLHCLALVHYLNGEAGVAKEGWRGIMERYPLYFPARMMYGEVQRQEGDIAGSLREQERVLEQDPQNMFSLSFAARAAMDGGDLAGAQRYLNEVRPAERQGFFVRVCDGILTALEGRREEALAVVDQQVQEWLSGNLLFGVEGATFFAALGETGRALDRLDRAVRLGDERAEYFTRNPLLAGLRDLPRFRQILASLEWRRKQRSKS